VNSIVPEPLKGFEQILIEMFHTDGQRINQVYKVVDSKVKVEDETCTLTAEEYRSTVRHRRPCSVLFVA